MEAVMGNLFAGLESLGLNIKDNVDVYEKEKKENQSAGVKKAQVNRPFRGRSVARRKVRRCRKPAVLCYNAGLHEAARLRAPN